MSSTIPIVPPRPAKTGDASLGRDIPQIPPRPRRPSDRNESPHRETYSRSPLNELPPGFGRPPPVYSHGNLSASDLPPRPPSVQLPSIGLEGEEYASLEQAREESSSPEQKRNIAEDLPLHQPKASLSQSSAKTRIQTVTRTDSDRAASAGLGKPHLDDDKHSDKHSLRARASFNRSNPTLASESRPGSVYEQERDDVGIPSFGLSVPMYPNAGDVQAPSPGPGTTTPLTPGVAFFNDPSQRNHHRRRSSRQDLNPPGSYGMHGHGLEPRDQFEKEWYQKHPQEMARELKHQYDPGHPRSEWALSSEELNKLVHSGNKGVTFAASTEPLATPDETVGYRASEEYASRQHSPKPVSGAKRPSSSSQAHAESPLRRTSFPFNDGRDTNALETDDEDDGARRVTLRSRGGHEYEVPILASDETSKYPNEGYAMPAVDHQPSYDHDLQPFKPSSRRGSDGHSRPTSRPGSMHGEPLSRFISQERHDGSGVGTPLAEIQEYEPLFPEDDKTDNVKPKNKHVRPDLARHHFPSQDVWEDNPDSLGLTATVSTPDLPSQLDREEKSTNASAVFEHPDKEAQRKDGPAASDRAHHLKQETEAYANPKLKPGVLQDFPTRPGMQPRFPSRDIWEDSPDSLHYETTVTTPQIEEPPNASPDLGSAPFGSAQPAPKNDETPQAERSAPGVPDRPKPVIPARPAKTSAKADPAATEVPPVKAKPAVPSRPAGKFSSIKASFMSDLNSRLQLGPQVPKRDDPKEEAASDPAPLADARKSRVKGPQRRKPTSALATAETITPSSLQSPPEIKLSFLQPHLIFSLDEEGELAVAQDPPRWPEAEAHSKLPPPAVGAEGDLPEPGVSDVAIEEQKAIQPELKEALSPPSTSTKEAAATANPEPTTSHAAKDQAQAGAHQSTQTGQQDVVFNDPDGSKKNITTFLGGHAPEEGNVTVKHDGDVEVSTGKEAAAATQTGSGL